MNEASAPNGIAHITPGSLLTFLPGMDSRTRDDIHLANLFAQKVARDELNEGLDGDWFRNYWRNLSFLGFDGKTVPALRRVGPERHSLGEEAIRQITGVGSAHLSTATHRSLKLLQQDPAALKLFQSHVRPKDTTHFQLLPCRQQPSGFVDMVLFHMSAKYRVSAVDFLFFASREDVQVIDLRVEMVRFNLAGFRAQYRDRVENAVGRMSLNALAQLSL